MQTKTVVGKLGRVVKTSRQTKGYTVSRLSSLRKCGASERTIRRLENAAQTGYNPKLDTLVKVANGLGISLDQLVHQIYQG